MLIAVTEKSSQNILVVVTQEIQRIVKVMKEQMRLISAKMQSDIEKEKVIANEILNNLFEERVTSSAEIATQSGINSAEHAEQGKRAV